MPLLVAAACRTQDVAEPQLRRPLETLPAGAQLLVLASDLHNTWQRLEAHQVERVLEQLGPSSALLRHPDVERLRQVLRSLEAAGIPARDDLLLNAVGGRAGLGLYAAEGGGPADLLLVSELRDPERFAATLDRLRREPVAGLPPSADDSAATRPAVRIRADDGRDLLLVQDGPTLVLSTRRDLIQQTFAVQAGEARAAAMREPEFVAGLEAIGPQNVVLLMRQAGGPGSGWAAQGLTWDARGLHFEHRAPAADTTGSAQAPQRRDAILRSIPNGMSFAGYVHTGDPEVRRMLQSARAGALDDDHDAAPDSAGAGHRAAPGGLDLGLPGLSLTLGNLLPWIGDEMGMALLDVEPTVVAPVPNFALLLEVRDAAQAQNGLGMLESLAGMITFGGGPRREFVDVPYGGQTYRSLAQPLVEAVTPSYLLDGDLAIVASTRELMHQIIDTRRVGKRHLLTDASFEPFAAFVPADARLVAYADQRRLHRATEQLGRAASAWNPSVLRGVRDLERIGAVLEHFPAGAVYLERGAEVVTVRGWMLEND
jgi:hypothetical protein